MDETKIYHEATAAGTKKLVPADGPLSALADRLADARNAMEEALDAAKTFGEAYAKVEAELFDALEQQGLTSIRTPRGLFRLNDMAWARIADAALAREWAEANMPEVITLNHTRLSVVVREALKGGRPIPPGIDFTMSRKITWRRT